MRVNTRKAIEDYGAKKYRRRCASIWTNGSEIYSYGARLLWSEPDGTVCLNIRKYSVTTTIHQNGLRERFGGFARLVDGTNLEQDAHAKKVDAEIAAEKVQQKENRKAIRKELRAAAQGVTVAVNRFNRAAEAARYGLSHKEKTFGGAARFL